MGELTPETLTSEYQWIIFSGIPVFRRSPPSSSQVSGRRNLNVCPLTPRSLEATEHFTGDAWGTSFPGGFRRKNVSFSRILCGLKTWKLSKKQKAHQFMVVLFVLHLFFYVFFEIPGETHMSHENINPTWWILALLPSK